MLYDRQRGIYVSNVKPDAYEVNGHRRTLEELHDEWEASKEWGYTTETFEAWKDRLASQGVIKAVFNYRKR